VRLCSLILMQKAGPLYHPQIIDEEDVVRGRVTNGSKTAVRDVVGFLCVSLCSRSSYKCLEAGFSSQDGDSA
jgi:hypothetical protein